MERRKRRRGFAFTISDYCPIDEYGFPPYKQIARSLGIDRDYGHLNIEAMINFETDIGQHTVMSFVLNKIADGERFAPGDRITYTYGWYPTEYTIEFRESEDAYGPCLRAVVLGVDEEYQSLPSHEAYEHIYTNPRRIDPLKEYE